MSTLTRRHRIEHCLLLGFDRLVRMLPHRVAVSLGIMTAGLIHFGFRFRVREARRRVRAVFGSRIAPHAARKIVWHSWKNIAISAVEILRASRLSNAWIEQHTNIKAVDEALTPKLSGGRGAVIACAHMGSWEMAGLAAQRLGIPAFAIAAPQKNPYFNDWMVKLRARAGIETLMRGDPHLVRDVIRRLKKGQVLAILPDVRASSPGLPTPFLGGVANIGPGMALFARLAMVPIIPCLTFRTDSGQHRFVVEQAIEPDQTLERDADISRMTHIVMRHIDTAIWEQPHQWFWFNKRWILDPVNE